MVRDHPDPPFTQRRTQAIEESIFCVRRCLLKEEKRELFKNLERNEAFSS